MSNPMKQHGTFSWNELMTTDVDAAKSFYGKLFDWQFEQAPGDMPYTMAKASEQDQELAGLMTIPPEAAGMAAYVGWVRDS